MEELKDDKITFIRPFVALDNEQALVERLHREMKKYYDVTTDEIASAVRAAYEEAEKVKTGKMDVSRSYDFCLIFSF